MDSSTERVGEVMNAQWNWRTLFVGRDQELERLARLWRHVKLGHPQLLVVLGESGLGKTRLVQEFYRWLNQHDDPGTEEAPEGYWPDAFGNEETSLDVNPNFDSEIHGRCPAPWLWWGMRFMRPERRNQVGSRCALSDYRHALIPHTERITVARQLKSLHKEAAWTGASDLLSGIPVLGQLLFPARNLLKLMREDWPKERELLESLRQSPAQVAQRDRLDLKSLALDYFRTILDTNNREASRIPVILFLDDAQWADATTLDFLYQLLREAIAEYWPLMVICTHWEVEWQEGLLAIAGDPPPQRLCHLPCMLGLGDDWQGLQQLAPVGDLSPVVAAAVTGLTTGQRRLVLAKAGGNPLLLEEILRYLLREPRLFDGQDPQRPLTERGEQEIAQRSFELHELVAERFSRLGEDVKRVLGWSSQQGMRFLTEITVAAARRVKSPIGDKEVRQAIREVERPHCFVQILGDRSRFNRAEFRQMAFHHVASEYLAYDTHELKVVRRAIRDTLASWLADGRIDDIPEEERLDALLMARSALSPALTAEAPNWPAWGNVLVRLVQLYRFDFLWDQALEVARTFADARSDGWPLADVAFWDQSELLDLLRTMCDYSRAGILARSLLTQAEDAAKSADGCNSLHQLHTVLTQLGDVEFAEGRRAESLAAYRRGLEISERFADGAGQTPESLDDMCASLQRIGDVELAEGRRAEAIAAFQRSLEIGERIAAQVGQTPESLHSICVSLSLIGDVELADDRRAEALAAFRRNLEISERIVAQVGQTPRTLRGLCVSLNQLGDVERAEGRRAEALAAYRRSLEINERIVAQFGHTPRHLRGLSVSLERIGDVELAEGRGAEALAAYRRSLEISERIAARFGETPESLRDLCAALNQLGDAERAEGRGAEAFAAYRHSLEISEQIVARFGPTPESLCDMSASLLRIGDAERAEGRGAEAIAAYQHSLDINERILAQFGETAGRLRGLIAALQRIGDAELVGGGRSEAFTAFRRSLEISERIVAQFGPTRESLSNLCASLGRIGAVTLAQGRHSESIRAYRRSLEISEQAVGQSGHTLVSLRGLMVAHWDLAVHACVLGDTATAVRELGLARLLTTRVANAGWDVAETQRDRERIDNYMQQVQVQGCPLPLP